MKHFYVYVDFTSDHVPFYVGKGNDKRIKDFRRSKKHKNVSNKHDMYRRIVLDTSDEQQAFSYEKLLIARLHTFIDDPEAPRIACNFTIGGEGAPNPSAETRRKRSEANRGRKLPPHSAEAKAKISAASRGRKLPPHSAEAKAKISAAHKNRSEEQKQETKAKLSEANRGRKMPPRSAETKAKMSKAHQNPSDEYRAKLSAAHRGLKHSDAAKAKISEAAKNRPPISAETKAKISEANRRRWERYHAEKEKNDKALNAVQKN
jgi:hypothetical protein